MRRRTRRKAANNKKTSVQTRPMMSPWRTKAVCSVERLT
jgi:hypothetical protein